MWCHNISLLEAQCVPAQVKCDIRAEPQIFCSVPPASAQPFSGDQKTGPEWQDQADSILYSAVLVAYKGTAGLFYGCDYFIVWLQA